MILTCPMPNLVEYIQYDFIYIKFKTCKTEQYLVKNKTM